MDAGINNKLEVTLICVVDFSANRINENTTVILHTFECEHIGEQKGKPRIFL